ncbi:MAG: hypothetical protein KC731_22320, partial [Myxococcales bacterium]|nr:hypothetical protein [Myxococcales bacterium]
EDVALRGLGLALSALTGDRAEAVHALARLTPTSSPLSVELALPEATRASALLAGTAGPAMGWWTLLLAPGAPGTSEPLDRLVVAGPPHLPQSAEARAATMQALLSMWRGWLSSSEPRAVRYTLFHAPGDMPAEVVPWLLAVGRLLRDDPGGPDPGPEIGTEIWLDAATAIDGPKLGLRFRAQTRLRAAAARGDEASAVAWREVVGRLARRGQRPGEAELWRLVGL